MWDRRVVEIVEKAVSHFPISCRFKNVVDQFEWAFIGVYGPNYDRDRMLLWEELFGLCSWWNVPWCVGMLCDFPLNVWALSFLLRLCISSLILSLNTI